ncbi:MAG TPA: MBOAT family O-acyltransferase [Burkholderiaceae bacterium]|nr:MBOAT family O-acyltransferase [Burkholderiaceae bacterium]
MLFTSTVFSFLFLPIVAVGFFALGRTPRAAAAWLGMASLFFYGYWAPQYVLLLLGSIVVNYLAGVTIGRFRDSGRDRAAHAALLLGLIFNLGLLGWFKYADFLIGTLRTVTGMDLPVLGVLLPIGISFFTFTQIAFLVDTWKKGTREYRFIHYLLFVTYFPHLIAGPVLHHAQMMPQFADPAIYRPQAASIGAGLVMFAIGLFKKIVLADGIAPYADTVFDGVAAGSMATPLEAWIGALAYTLQLYFDFSGYSDMAVGLSMIFGVRLPFNFDSPYRAANISQFWRSWHMTLSAFLRDYLYIAMGGNRRGPNRRIFNLMATMLLGGLWHGAAWTFVVWGGLHGLFLVIHHQWGASATAAARRIMPAPIVTALAWLLTMFAVVVAWVFFRAASFDAAGSVLMSMFSPWRSDGVAAMLFNAGLSQGRGMVLIGSLSLIALLPWNSNRLFDALLAAARRIPGLAWASVGFGLVISGALVVVSELRTSTSPFIYFNF